MKQTYPIYRVKAKKETTLGNDAGQMLTIPVGAIGTFQLIENPATWDSLNPFLIETIFGKKMLRFQPKKWNLSDKMSLIPSLTGHGEFEIISMYGHNSKFSGIDGEYTPEKDSTIPLFVLVA